MQNDKSDKLDLLEIRQRIDNIDDKLVKLLEERLEIVSDVAKYKKSNNKKIFDPKRENEVIKKNIDKVKISDHTHYIEKILVDLMNVSKEYQKYKIGEKFEYIGSFDFTNSKMGYTGVPGSYAHEVLTNVLYNKRVSDNHANELTKFEIYNFKSHEDLVEAVSNYEIDFAVIPIENTLTGEVRDTVDLINEKDVYIVGEIKHKIEHRLLGIKKVDLEQLTKVFSHEQALMQCSKFLNNLNNIEQISMSNTAISAEFVSKEKNPHYSCIASKYAQEMYNLELLKEDISNIRDNYTRFIIISNKMLITNNAKKISIITSTTNEAGALFKLLEEFSKNNLSMMSIKSRPIINKPWEYYFYIDFEGNLKDEPVKRALEVIREKSNYLKILGNYNNLSEEA